MVRLDKFIADALNITRSEAKAKIKSKAVTVNGTVAKAADMKCGDNDEITVDGAGISSERFVYIMMNKPEGVISASGGKGYKTVIDLLPDEMKRKGLFPAGRLDKDTTGFMLITNDGAFAHNILSPSKHIDKTYIAVLDKPIDQTIINDFQNGMELDGKTLLSAALVPLNDGLTTVEITLRQGLYHQIKRMFVSYGITVTQLTRISMGGLLLDDTLAPGECRYLTQDELKQIIS